MSVSQKPLQRLSAVVRGRKLKGQNFTLYITLDHEIAQKLGITKGDLVELEIKKVSRESNA